MDSQFVNEFNDLTKGRQYSQMNADTLGELFKRVEGMKKLISDMSDAVCASEYQILKSLEALGEKTPYKQTVAKYDERVVDMTRIYKNEDIQFAIGCMAVSKSPYSEYVARAILKTEKDVAKLIDSYNGFRAWAKENTDISDEDLPDALSSETVEKLMDVSYTPALFKTGQFEGQPKLNVGSSLDEKRGTMTARNNYAAVYGIENLRL